MVKVNGEERPCADGDTLAACLVSMGCDEHRVACELNGEIVPREDYDIQVLSSPDVLEIVQFVGGG